MRFSEKDLNKGKISKEWLYNHSVDKKMSRQRIADLIGVTHETIRYWMKTFDISCRSRGEAMHLIQANHCDLSQEAIEWINGELLGDGCLTSHSKYSARFAYSSKYFEYTQYISNILKSFNIKQSGKINKANVGLNDNRITGNCYIYRYGSLNYVELLSIYKRWYPNGKKVVPGDLELTPLTCRQWYIGDGCLTHSKNCRTYIRMATNGFPVSGVEYLVKQLNELNFKATRQTSSNTIRISAYSTEDFLNYIGDSPVKCYEYKWDNHNKRECKKI